MRSTSQPLRGNIRANARRYPLVTHWITVRLVCSSAATKNASLSSERSLLAANVAVQIVKAMINLYQESDAKTKPLVVAEFRRVLTSYLEEVLTSR
jgi:hypothetical protein